MSRLRISGRSMALLVCVVTSMTIRQAPQTAKAQAPSGPVWTADALTKLGPSELDALYRQGVVGCVPTGKVKGTALVKPGSPVNTIVSKASRAWWQGKVFERDGQSAINQFAGIKVIKGRVYQGTSWLDGQPSMILDYDGTSIIYGNYRDEIRMVGPGLYLGLMYARTEPTPRLKMYFAFETTP